MIPLIVGFVVVVITSIASYADGRRHEQENWEGETVRRGLAEWNAGDDHMPHWQGKDGK